MKALIFDSGPLINLSMNGLLFLLEELKKTFNGKFLITESVKYEVVDRPIGIYRFELGALRVKNLIEQGILELPEQLDISGKEIRKEALRLMNIANHAFSSNGRPIRIISEAESSCLALSAELGKRDVENIIAIDERTTRILSEKPENLEKLLSDKLHETVRASMKELSIFKQFRFIRSTEIVYVACKKGLLKMSGPKVLEAALYATKFKGSAVSYEEIEALKKL